MFSIFIPLVFTKPLIINCKEFNLTAFENQLLCIAKLGAIQTTICASCKRRISSEHEAKIAAHTDYKKWQKIADVTQKSLVVIASET